MSSLISIIRLMDVYDAIHYLYYLISWLIQHSCPINFNYSDAFLESAGESINDLSRYNVKSLS